MNTKQVIVMRKDLGMRKGKMVAQGAHASLGAVLIHGSIATKLSHLIYLLFIKSELRSWLLGSFRKICVSVDSEAELLEIHNRAKEVGLINCLITDNGDTEFNGIKTITCCAIGPAYDEDIDKITGHLKLL